MRKAKIKNFEKKFWETAIIGDDFDTYTALIEI